MADVDTTDGLEQLAANRDAHTGPMSAEMTGRLFLGLLNRGMGGAAAGGVVELFVIAPRLSPQVAAAMLDATKLLCDGASGAIDSDRGGVQEEGSLVDASGLLPDTVVDALEEDLPSVARGTSTEPKPPSPLAMPRRKGELSTRSPRSTGSPSPLPDGATVALRGTGPDREQETTVGTMSKHAESVSQLLSQEQTLFGHEAVEQHPEATTLALSFVVTELIPKRGKSLTAEERARRLTAIKESENFTEAARALSEGSDGKAIDPRILQPLIERQGGYVDSAKSKYSPKELQEFLDRAIEALTREDEPTPSDSDSGDGVEVALSDAPEEPKPADQNTGEVDAPKDPTVLTELSQYLLGEGVINPRTAIRLAYEDLYTKCPKTPEFDMSRVEVAATWWRLGMGSQKTQDKPSDESVISSAEKLRGLLATVTDEDPNFLHDQPDVLTALRSFVEDISKPRHLTDVTVSLMRGNSRDSFPDAERVKYCLISGLSQLYDVARKHS